LFCLQTEIAEHTGACDLRQSSCIGRAASESSSSRGSGSGSGGLKYGSGDTLSDFVTFVCEETRKNQQLVSLLSLQTACMIALCHCAVGNVGLKVYVEKVESQ